MSDTPDSELADVYYLETIEQLRAVAEPTRYRMITLLSTPRTGAQLAREIGIPRSRAHYHLKHLEQAGLVRLHSVDESQAITERYYQVRGRVIDFTKLLPVDAAVRDDITIETFNAVSQFLATMLEASRLSILASPPDIGAGHGIWFDFEGSLTPEHYDSLVQRLTELRADVVEMSDKSDPRAERYHTTLFLSRLDRPPPKDPEPEPS